MSGKLPEQYSQLPGTESVADDFVNAMEGMDETKMLGAELRRVFSRCQEELVRRFPNEEWQCSRYVSVYSGTYVRAGVVDETPEVAFNDELKALNFLTRSQGHILHKEMGEAMQAVENRLQYLQKCRQEATDGQTP
jgi:hypothetical protein